MAENCPNNKLWILVSRNDEKAFPGMNAVAEAMEKAGAKVGRYCWNAKSADLNAEAQKSLADNVNVRYTVFEGSSVVPEGEVPHSGANHVEYMACGLPHPQSEGVAVLAIFIWR